MKMRRLRRALGTSILLAAVIQRPALAAPGISARLTEFPAFVAQADTLRISLEIVNTGSAPVDGLQVAVSIHEGVVTRSQLQRTFKGRLGSVVGSDTFDVDVALQPGETRTITIEKPLSEISAFRSSVDDRAYPVRIVVRGGALRAAPIDTHMVFFASPAPEPLRLAIVIPLHSASIYTSGKYPTIVSSGSLEKSISSGAIEGILSALEKFPDAPVTIAPSGLLVDMLSDMGGGYSRGSGAKSAKVAADDPRAVAAARTLARIEAIAQRPLTRSVPMPYSAAFLPALVRSGLTDRALAQLDETRRRLEEPGGAGKPLEGWFLPTPALLDERTLTELTRTGLGRVILEEASLRRQPPPLTTGAPLNVTTRTGGRVSALVADAGLTGLLADISNLSTAQARQRFLADTVTIYLERPAIERGVVTVGPVTGVDGARLESILGPLSAAPWLRLVTPDAITSGSDNEPSSQVELRSTEDVIRAGPEGPGTDYFLALGSARRALDRYAELSPPPEQTAAFERRLLIAESAEWWASKSLTDKGRSFAREIPAAVERQLSLVKGPGPQTITLTSRTGVLPLTVTSSLKYPVHVIVKLSSDRLTFPDGQSIKLDALAPGTRTLTVRTVTKGAGTFPLRVRLETGGGSLISESRLTIRSTAYSIVAVSITSGAALFLVLWWIVTAARRRLRPKP